MGTIGMNDVAVGAVATRNDSVFMWIFACAVRAIAMNALALGATI